MQLCLICFSLWKVKSDDEQLFLHSAENVFKGIHILVSETCEIREISEMYTVYNIVSFQKTTADWTILIVHLVTF